MKVALDLLCCSKRVVDAVVASFPGNVAPDSPKADSETDAATVATTKDEADDKSESATNTILAKMPHSRVFVYVPAPPGKALAGDEFYFVLGCLRMKARYIQDKEEGATGQNPTKVAAALPQEAAPSGLSARFFSAIARSSDPTKFYVKAPPDLQPGETFEVSLFGQKIRIRGPTAEMISPDPPRKCGRKFRICCPKKRTNGQCQLLQFQLTGTRCQDSAACGGNKLPDKNKTEVRRIEHSNPPAFLVTVPPGTKTKEQFPIFVQGQQFLITCPPGVRPGKLVRVELPILGDGSAPQTPPENKQTTRQLFEVTVPEGTKPEGEFCVLAYGNRVLLTCPKNAEPGKRLRFQLPVAEETVVGQETRIRPASQEMAVGKWSRAIRAKDLKLQWVPKDNERLATCGQRFSTDGSLYLRQLEFRHNAGEDHRFRQGALSLVPAHEVILDTKVAQTKPKGHDNHKRPRFAIFKHDPTILWASQKNFLDKVDWFQEACTNLRVPWDEGGLLRLNVRRETILQDSFQAVMSLSRKDMRKIWRFEMIGESGIEDGGLSRDIYRMIYEEILDPKRGLWKPSEQNPSRMAICSLASGDTHSSNDDHMLYYRFFGRILGKALFDGQTIGTANHRLEKHIYKFLLQWPLQFQDLEDIDQDYFNNLMQLPQLAKAGEDISFLCLDFTTTSEVCNDGVRREIELVKGGADIEVTNENLPEYLEACFKHKMMGKSIQPQLTELLLGFTDVLPESLLTVFNIEEFETLIHGVHDDSRVDAYMESAQYSGAFKDAGGDHPTCRLFWEVVSEMEFETRDWLFHSVARNLSENKGCTNTNIPNLILHGIATGPLQVHGNQIAVPLLSLQTKKELGDALRLLAKRPGAVVNGKK